MTSPIPTNTASLWRASARGHRPPRRVPVSEWAERNRVMPLGLSPEPGPFRLARTPYIREPMDCFSPHHPAQEIVITGGSQLAKTEVLLSVVGYYIDLDPCSMLVVYPTVDTGAKRFSQLRLKPLIDTTPSIRAKVPEAKSRDSGSSMYTKEFPGGVLFMTGANSGAGLRMMPIRVLLGDEVDAYPRSVGEEGDPISLAKRGTQNFWNRKIGWFSTPLFEGSSLIWLLYLESDQRKYFVPCQHCGEMQTVEEERIVWPKNEPWNAMFHCLHCGAGMDRAWKIRMLPRGEWRPQAPGPGKAWGYHIPGLISPWRTWEGIAREKIAAAKSPEKMQTYVNLTVGMPWKEPSDAPGWQRLYDRRESYPAGRAPSPDVLFLTAGVDVQMNRIEVDVWGWGLDKQSWLIDSRVIHGDTARAETWAELGPMLNETWPSPRGPMRLARLAVDSGAFTQYVYAWARTQPRDRVMVVKGVEGFNRTVPVATPQKLDKTSQGKRVRRGIAVWPVHVNVFKSELYGWLRMDRPTEESGEPYPEGYVHIFEVGEEWVRQLTAERHVIGKDKHGYPMHKWELDYAQNHALDKRNYARAAAWVEGLDRLAGRPVVLERKAARHILSGAPTPESPKPIPAAEPSTPETLECPAAAPKPTAPVPAPPAAKPAQRWRPRDRWGQRRKWKA